MLTNNHATGTMYDKLTWKYMMQIFQGINASRAFY